MYDNINCIHDIIKDLSDSIRKLDKRDKIDDSEFFQKTSEEYIHTIIEKMQPYFKLFCTLYTRLCPTCHQRD